MRKASAPARTISSEEAACFVRSDMWLDYGVGLSQPDVFDKALAARKDSLRNVKIRSCLTMKPRAVLDEDTGPFRHVVYELGNTLLGLHGFPDLASDEPFDERRPGLDHIAFGCASRGELVEWAARLDELGIAHGGIVDAGYGSGLSFRDPDTIALELFAPPE